MRVIHVIEDDWEVDLEILVTPNNDVWMSRDNHSKGWGPHYPARPGGYRDKTAYYVHFDAAIILRASLSVTIVHPPHGLLLLH